VCQDAEIGKKFFLITGLCSGVLPGRKVV
jgi:hypothetical protein